MSNADTEMVTKKNKFRKDEGTELRLQAKCLAIRFCSPKVYMTVVSSVFLLLNKMSGTSFSTRTLDITEDIAVFNECANLSGKAFSQVMEHYKISVACSNSFSTVSNSS